MSVWIEHNNQCYGELLFLLPTLYTCYYDDDEFRVRSESEQCQGARIKIYFTMECNMLGKCTSYAIAF